MGSFESHIDGIIDQLLEDYRESRDIDKIELFRQPDKQSVIDVVHKLIRIVYPGYYRDNNYRVYNAKHHLSVLMEDVIFHLTRQIVLVLQSSGMDTDEAHAIAEEICISFFREIPKVRAMVQKDLEAAFDGDPAAGSKDEIIYCYPGLFAITINRLAHVLYSLDVPMIPRMMTEYAHSSTGIDIHPGATIGEYFFIDHGTGIVVGETTVIGNNVKVYQGVTLGALTTKGGQKLRGKRRHPTIEDNVTIYAGASILGGDTVIGHDSVIGSNAFITRSIAPYTTVSIKNQELQYKQRQLDPNRFD